MAMSRYVNTVSVIIMRQPRHRHQFTLDSFPLPLQDEVVNAILTRPPLTICTLSAKKKRKKEKSERSDLIRSCSQLALELTAGNKVSNELAIHTLHVQLIS